MSLISFYPGPSRVFSNLTEYIYEAYMEGYMSCNHRSPKFMELYADVRQLMKEKMDLPSDYDVFFVSSATECWEILAQSLTIKTSQHFYNGSFGEKWADTAHKMGVNVMRNAFDIQQTLPADQLTPIADLICVTQNETSNGSCVGEDILQQLRNQLHENQLLAVDATSSFGGVKLPLAQADVWYASVQKCMGLPAGMALLILSPRAIDRAIQINENAHYNSLVSIISNGRKNQTHYTPNVLNIYLLKRTLGFSKGIKEIDLKIKARQEQWREIVHQFDELEFLIAQPELQSPTVITLTHKEPVKIINAALEQNIELGKGYGEWKTSTLRIANFPAIKSKEIEKLAKFLLRHVD